MGARRVLHNQSFMDTVCDVRGGENIHVQSKPSELPAVPDASIRNDHAHSGRDWTGFVAHRNSKVRVCVISELSSGLCQDPGWGEL